MMPSLRLTALILVTALICTSVVANALQAPACRTFTAEEVRTASGAAAGTISQACRFDLPTTSRICAMRTRLSHTSFDVTITDKYNSVDDFVDEVRVVPPVAKLQTQSRRVTSGSGVNAVITYQYDAAGRQTRLSTNMGGNLLVSTYGGWDPKGRPTTAIVSSKASTINLQYKYDDALRTMTTTNPVGVQIETYDADGNIIRSESTDGGGKTTFAFKLNKMDKVCK